MGTTNPILTTTYQQIATGVCFMQNRGNTPVEVVFDTAPPAETMRGVLLAERDQKVVQNNFGTYNVYARLATGYPAGSYSLVLVV